MMKKRSLVRLGLFASAAFGAACSSSSNSPVVLADAGGDGSHSSSVSSDAAVADTGSGGGSTSSGSDSGLSGPGDAAAASDTGSMDAGSDAGGCGDVSTLYARLHGHAGIRAALNAVVVAEVGNPMMATYFGPQLKNPVPAGHPTAGQIAECLTDQLGNAAGGPEAYPPDGGAYDDGGGFAAVPIGDAPGFWACRDMTTIHADLDISGGTFDEFVMIAANELSSLGVCAADIGIIGSVLNGAKPAIVNPALADAGFQALPADAGGD